ncbi:MAG TPA: 7-carboxy-7-deazaguanine synthase [Saprospiraceae bacterium]|nr:7-carboxy-7-deazaguanine synthase [Saprospiraceae bacterium]
MGQIYSVKEIFYTLQGEGFHSGRAVVFLRFSGCNLWSGREEDRAKAKCKFCDTDFVGIDGENGGKYNAAELAELVNQQWPISNGSNKMVVCTGGEPMLQLDRELLSIMQSKGFFVAIETNGTIPVLEGIDWICVSPKPQTEIVQIRGNELKFIYPQPDLDPQQFEELAFEHYFVQPMDGLELQKNTESCVQFCKSHPMWKLSLQTHKILGIP